MTLPANLTARLTGPAPVKVGLVEIALPGGTRRYSAGPYSSVATGHYEGKLLSATPIKEETSGESGDLQAIEVTYEIKDLDRSLAALFTGASAHLVVGSAVTSRMAEIGVAEADWSTRFSGVVSNVGFSKPLVAFIRARTNDLALRKKMPRPCWLITQADFPNAQPESYGKLWPMPYGKLTASPYTATGALECYLVDTVRFRYLVSAGRAKAVDRVYKDGVLQATSAYSVLNTTVNGRAATLLVFTTGQGASTITADVQGYEATGDGSGALIETQTGILAHKLTNFVLGDYRSGNWLSTDALIDATYLSALATFLGDRNYKGAHALLAQTTGLAMIRAWLRGIEAVGFWTPLGKLAFAVEDPTFTDIYNAAIVTTRQDAGFAPGSDDQGVVSSIAVDYALMPADGQYFRTLEVSDPGGDPDAVDKMEQPYGALE